MASVGSLIILLILNAIMYVNVSGFFFFPFWRATSAPQSYDYATLHVERSTTAVRATTPATTPSSVTTPGTTLARTTTLGTALPSVITPGTTLNSVTTRETTLPSIITPGTTLNSVTTRDTNLVTVSTPEATAVTTTNVTLTTISATPEITTSVFGNMTLSPKNEESLIRIISFELQRALSQMGGCMSGVGCPRCYYCEGECRLFFPC